MTKQVTKIVEVNKGSSVREGTLAKLDFLYSSTIPVININKDKKLRRCIVQKIEPDVIVVAKDGDVEVMREILVYIEREEK